MKLYKAILFDGQSVYIRKGYYADEGEAWDSLSEYGKYHGSIVNKKMEKKLLKYLSKENAI